MRTLLISVSALALFACGQEAGTSTSEAEKEEIVAEEEVAEASGDAMGQEEMTNDAALEVILGAQPEEVQARYQYRNPKETLQFFGVEPGMTVVDTLPGNPWYSGILMDYLGPEGTVVGADYSPAMWAEFGNFAPPEGAKDNWAAEWVETASSWRDDDGDAQVAAFAYGNVPDEMAGTVDVILQMRSLHHFARFEDEGAFMTEALADMNTLLKPGGVVGVVAHRAPEGNDDEWATGDNGYLKQSAVIAMFEAAGFELAGESEINANPKDQPSNEDFVWRLPPALATSREDEELRAAMTEIGESDRMTLLFRKPA